jgi:hypothetical protein
VTTTSMAEALMALWMAKCLPQYGDMFEACRAPLEQGMVSAESDHLINE